MINTWIDLSIKISQDTRVYPGDSKLKISLKKNLSKDGYNLTDINLNMHIGTHIDFKSHVLAVNEEIKLANFIGKANKISVLPVENVLRTKAIEKQFNLLTEKHDILILATEHEKNLNQTNYYKQPKFEESILAFLVKHKIKLFGADLPSFEYIHDEGLLMHK